MYHTNSTFITQSLEKPAFGHHKPLSLQFLKFLKLGLQTIPYVPNNKNKSRPLKSWKHNTIIRSTSCPSEALCPSEIIWPVHSLATQCYNSRFQNTDLNTKSHFIYITLQIIHQCPSWTCDKSLLPVAWKFAGQDRLETEPKASPSL